MEQPSDAGVFWLKRGLEEGQYRVLINGQPRTDYELIIRVRDGTRGVLFNGLTYDELCGVQIQGAPKPRHSHLYDQKRKKLGE